MNQRVRQTLFPLLAAFIWGIAFVAQSVGAEHIGPLTFISARYAIGALVLVPLLLYIWRRDPLPHRTRREAARKRKVLLEGGFFCGLMLLLGSFFQQYGIAFTTAGKAGFITALYIVLVPLLGLFFRRKVGILVWIGVAMSVAGLYLLCIKEGFSIGTGDFYVLLCALAFSGHILVVDHYAPLVGGVELSCVQFLVASAMAGVAMLVFESPTLASLQAGLVPLLYVGVLSSGVAFTLQIVAQNGGNPTLISLLLSLESVFAVLAGAFFLGETMSVREMSGCALMFGAVILAQIPLPSSKK